MTKSARLRVGMLNIQMEESARAIYANACRRLPPCPYAETV
jgi:hypothetical protein